MPAYPTPGPEPQKTPGGISGFLNNLGPEDYGRLMRFGVDLMNASQPTPGAIVGPTLLGAVGKAGATSIARNQKRELLKKAEQRATAKARAEERYHQDKMTIERQKLYNDRIKNAQSEDTKQLLIQIKQQQAEMSRKIDLAKLSTDTMAAIGRVRDRYDKLISSALIGPGTDAEQTARIKQLQQEEADSIAAMHESLRNISGQGPSKEMGQAAAAYAAPTKTDDRGRTVYDFSKAKDGDHIQLRDGRVGVWQNGRLMPLKR